MHLGYDDTRVFQLSSIPLNLTTTMPTLQSSCTNSLTEVTAPPLQVTANTPLCGGQLTATPLVTSSTTLSLPTSPVNINLLQNSHHNSSAVIGGLQPVVVDQIQQHGVDTLQYHQVDQHGNPVYAQLEQVRIYTFMFGNFDSVIRFF
jgi:hypothetical protein